MNLSLEAVVKCLNESLKGSNLGGVGNWDELITTYFTSASGTLDSDSESDSESCSDIEETATDITNTYEAEEKCIQETECDVVTVDNTTSLVKDSGLNLVSEQPEMENQTIRDFKCSCKLNNGIECCSLFSFEDNKHYRMEMHELQRHEKDLVILAKIAAHIQRSSETECRKRKKQTSRKRVRLSYYHEGSEICREMFKFLHSISQDELTGLITWYKENGLKPKKCKSGARIRGRALCYEDVMSVVTFITNFAEANALVLPGRVPGYKRSDIKLLPSCETKASIWRTYRATLNADGKRAVKLSAFRSLWRQLLPNIDVTKPMTDLCWRCQENNTKIYRSANTSDEEKSSVLKEQEDHLRVVQLERSYYRDLVEACKDVVAANHLDLGKSAPNSKPIAVHYSFDFAQQVFYPNDPLQPGPVYFLTPRKCGIFGVCCEGVPKQVNFLIDEGSSVSEGSHSVISYIDYFFINYGLGEQIVYLHADNCSGQNKTYFLLWYLCWRVMQGEHTDVAIHFLIAGHTKFVPNWCFGLLKQKYRKTPVSCLADIVEVVKKSTVTGANVPQLVGQEDGTQIVATRDWQTFLSPYFRTLPGIKSNQHYRFSAKAPGVVFYKKQADSEEQEFQLLRDATNQPPKERPTPIVMPQLDPSRVDYLYNRIRPFVREDVRYIVCPTLRNNRKRALEAA